MRRNQNYLLLFALLCISTGSIAQKTKNALLQVIDTALHKALTNIKCWVKLYRLMFCQKPIIRLPKIRNQ